MPNFDKKYTCLNIRYDEFIPNNSFKNLEIISNKRSNKSSRKTELMNHDEFKEFKKSIRIVLTEIRKLANRMQWIEEIERRTLCWNFAGKVLDRTCLYIFGTLTLSSALGILFSSINT